MNKPVFRTHCGVTIVRAGRSYQLVSPCCAVRITAKRQCAQCAMKVPADSAVTNSHRLERLIRLASAAYGTTCPDPHTCSLTAVSNLYREGATR